MSINQDIKVIKDFQGNSLTGNLANIEKSIVGLNSSDSGKFCQNLGIDDKFMQSALSVKEIASNINIIIHAVGILQSLSFILEKGERIESVSLGAGNTGKKFDLETSNRVAEFKFIDWKGGSESIRQNGIFKDFYSLAEYKTDKNKILYVVGTKYPLKFFQGSRKLTSVLSKQPKILEEISIKYSGLNTTKDYYAIHKNNVAICDVSQYVGRSV